MADSQDPSRDDDRARRRSSNLVGALYTMIASLGLGVAIGWALDRHFATQPWWTVGASMLGLVVGFYQLIRETRR